MRKLGIFNFISLNGFYKGLDEDISWHIHGGEENKFSEESVGAGAVLLFGRVTYQLMANFWPTEAAKQNFPIVAEGMNKAEKIVFSRTLKNVEWNNSRIISDDIAAAVKQLKQTSGKDMCILGSGSIITQFAGLGLIDQYQFMIDPVVLPNGTPLFQNLTSKLELKLADSKIFKSGHVVLTYEPRG